MKKEVEKQDQATKRTFEAGGSCSEAENIGRSDLEVSSSSLGNDRDRSSSSETNEFWDHDP